MDDRSRSVPGQFMNESLMSMDFIPPPDKPVEPHLAVHPRPKYSAATVANSRIPAQMPNVGVKTLALASLTSQQTATMINVNAGPVGLVAPSTAAPNVEIKNIVLPTPEPPTITMADVSIAEQSKPAEPGSLAAKRNHPEDDENSELCDVEDMLTMKNRPRLPKVRLVQCRDSTTLLPDHEVELNALRVSLNLMSTQKESAEEALATLSTEFEAVKKFRSDLLASEEHQKSLNEKLKTLLDRVLELEAERSACDAWKARSQKGALTQTQEVIEAKEKVHSADIATQTIFPMAEHRLDSAMATDSEQHQEYETLLQDFSDLTNKRDRLLLEIGDSDARLQELEQKHKAALEEEKNRQSVQDELLKAKKIADRLQDELQEHKSDLQEEKSKREKDLEVHRRGQGELSKLKSELGGLQGIKETADRLEDELRECKSDLREEKSKREKDLEVHRRGQGELSKLKSELGGLQGIKETADRLEDKLRECKSDLREEKSEREKDLEAHRRGQGELSRLKSELDELRKIKKTAARLQELHQGHEAKHQKHLALEQTLEQERDAHSAAIKNFESQVGILQEATKKLRGDIATEKEARVTAEKALTGRDSALLEVTKERDNMKQERDTRTKEARDARDTLDSQRAEIQRLTTEVQDLETERNTDQAEFATVKARIAGLERTNQEQKEEAEKQRGLARHALSNQHLEHTKELIRKGNEYQAQLDDKDNQLADLKQQLNALERNPQTEDFSHQDEDTDMESSPSKAKGKRPEKPALTWLEAGKRVENRGPQPRTNESVEMFRRREHEPAVIAPPMDFARPYGVPMSRRFRSVTPAANVSRANTPAYHSGKSTRDSTPGPSRTGLTGFHSTPLRDPRRSASPQRAPPPSHSLNSIDTLLPPRPGPSNSPRLSPPANSSDPLANSSLCPDAAPDHPPSETVFADLLKRLITEIHLMGDRVISAVGQSPLPARRSKARPHGEFKTQSPPKPRTVARGVMMNAVRLEMNSLLDIKVDADITTVVQNTLVDENEVQDYLDSNIDPPPLQPLRIFWQQPNHPWNRHMARAFTKHFIEEEPEFAGDETLVAAHFTQRLDTLRKILKAHMLREGEQTTEEASLRVLNRYQDTCRNKRVRERRVGLFQHRLDICDREIDRPLNDHAQRWQVLRDMVNLLGANGVSSDESGDEDYAIRSKTWRSTEVKNLIREVDNNRAKVGALGNPLPGARPRKRTRGRYPPISKSSAVPCLPINFYDRAWYDSLTDQQKVDLDVAAATPLPEPI